MPAAKPRTKAAKQNKTHKVMKEYKEGTLKSGPKGKGGKVKSRKQAIAIAMSESGQSRAKSRKAASKTKTSSRKTATRKTAKRKTTSTRRKAA